VEDGGDGSANLGFGLTCHFCNVADQLSSIHLGIQISK
jgi:hypothetical protein